MSDRMKLFEERILPIAEFMQELAVKYGFDYILIMDVERTDPTNIVTHASRNITGASTADISKMLAGALIGAADANEDFNRQTFVEGETNDQIRSL